MARRRSNGEGCVRKRSDGRWEGIYTVGHDLRSGKIVRRSVYGKTQSEVRAKMTRALQENRGPVIDHAGNYTVQEWLVLWYEMYSKPYLKPTTAAGYENYINNHIIPGLGRIRLRQLSPLQIQQFYLDEQKTGRKGQREGSDLEPLSARVIRSIHALLKMSLQKAVELRILNYNPCDGCRVPKLTKKEMTILPPEQVGSYLKSAEEMGILAIFYLELTSGLRRGEIAGLHMEDLDLKTNVVTIRRTVCRVGSRIVVNSPKTENSIRQVLLPEKAVQLLCEFHKQYKDTQIVFPDPATGDYMDPNWLYRAHKRIMKRAGIDEKVRFHDLRHTFSTIALLNGVDPKTVSNILGHHSTVFTLDTYAHVTRHMQADAVDKISTYMDDAIDTT